MAREPKDKGSKPSLSQAGRARASAREARRAAALRRNLRRRKAQERARVEAPSGDKEPPGPGR
ncbi:MAG: hypothetical protein ACE5JZ_10030 [Kiloniellales bacterium]